MAKRAPNPNTAYGRKRLRDEYPQRVANMTPKEREKHQSAVSTATTWLWIIVIAICLIAFLIGGMPALMSTLKFMTNQ